MVSIAPGTVINGYTFLEAIGEGGFACVYKVFNKTYNQVFVAKVMKCKSEQDEGNWPLFSSELQSLCALDHPNVIRLYNYFKQDGRFFLILEYCPGGNLYDLIQRKGALTGDDLMRVTDQLISALSYVHRQNIAHRDIKPQNILFDSFGRVKLADFGISRLNSGDDLCAFTCSIAFAAPELLNRHPHSPYACDIWALGVTLYFISHARLPWPADGINEMKKAIRFGAIYIDAQHVSTTYGNLIKNMIRLDPGERMLVTTPAGVKLSELPESFSAWSVQEGSAKKRILKQSSAMTGISLAMAGGILRAKKSLIAIAGRPQRIRETRTHCLLQTFGE